MTETINIPFDVKLLAGKKLTTPVFSCIYEYGNLRYIKVGSAEVIRLIYCTLRDENWNTIPFKIEDEKISENEKGFLVSYMAVFSLNTIKYKASIQIKAFGDRIVFSMKGEALSTFKRNRIGICVLHPLKHCSGKEVSILTTNGHAKRASFPEAISAHQPFKDMKQLNYPADENYNVSIEFQGDIFETEDQRNWGDDSFKTYGGPVELPLPVEVATGEKIEQKVKITAIAYEKPVKEIARSQPSTAKLPFPALGYCRVNNDLLTGQLMQLLKLLPFDHYRVELHLNTVDWRNELNSAISDAKALSAKLELVTFFSEQHEKEQQEFMHEIAVFAESIESILILQENKKTTPPDLLRTIYPLLKAISAHIKIGYGTSGFFAEVNRNPPVNVPFDFLAFGLTPQAHLDDTRTLLENLDAQAHTLETFSQLFGNNQEVHISPVSLKFRTDSQDSMGKQAPDYDERLHISFGAAWTLISIRNLSAAKLTFYDTHGYRGIISDEHVSTGNASTLYRVLAALRSFNPHWILPFDERSPLNIVFEDEHGKHLIFELDPLYLQYATGPFL